MNKYFLERKIEVCIMYRVFPSLFLLGGHHVPLALRFRGHFKFYGDINNVKVKGRHFIFTISSKQPVVFILLTSHEFLVFT